MLGELCRRYGVRQLRLFGSGVRADFDSNASDLDFLAVFDEPPEGMNLAKQFFGFQAELEELFSRRVDLLEEGFIENPFIKKSAEEEAVTLYAA